MGYLSVDVALFDDYVSEVDPDPKGDALVLLRFRVAVSHCPLHFDSAANRIDYVCPVPGAKAGCTIGAVGSYPSTPLAETPRPSHRR